jgi:hypothetical protein
MRRIYQAGGLGKLVYAEGEYFHYMDQPLASYQDWRVGLPPQFYPTHSNAYYHCVTGGSFTEVSCLGMPSVVHHLKPENNRYAILSALRSPCSAPAKAAAPGWR